MASLDFVDTFKDPIYGIIPVTWCERDLLRLPLLNRLRSVKQLGLGFLAFPGANHTRFEHSIGTIHVASLIAQSLGLKEHEIEFIRIAALLIPL
jgi:HD superfamily phosphohydrolase